MISDIKAKFTDTPTIVVNSAGITRDSLFLRLQEDKYDQVLNVNLKVYAQDIIKLKMYYRSSL